MSSQHDWPAILAACLVAGASIACSSARMSSSAVTPSADGTTATDAAESAATADAAPADIVDTGLLYLDECASLPKSCAGSTDPDCGKCQYQIRYDASKCSAANPCDNLLLLFAAGGCRPQLLTDVVDGNPDFVAACVQPVAPGEVLPATLGAPERENIVIPYVLDRLRGEAWSGKNLLLGGCSMGATRYPVVAARYSDDAAWMGSEKTAACMSDGVVSLTFQDEFIGEKLGVGPSCASRHARMARAYTRAQPIGGHSCSASPGDQCACDPDHAVIPHPGDCAGGDCVLFDSIVRRVGDSFALAPGVSPTSFAVTDWKLISEGSAFADTDDRCEMDVVPEAPFRALCLAIDADPDRRCTFESFPDAQHCGYYGPNFNALCVDWFRGL